MSGSPMLPQKRGREHSMAVSGPPLTEAERRVYEAIRKGGDMGVFSSDMKKEMDGMGGSVVDKVLKSLQVKGLVKVVVNIRNRARKCLMAAEFEPSKEISGGTWYADGALDTGLISTMRAVCKGFIKNNRAATANDIFAYFNSSRVFKTEITLQQTLDIVRAMILDREIEEVKSTGTGDFANVPVGRVCYRMPLAKDTGPKLGAFSSIPCGVCPRISECTPDGVISPKTCVYYNQWLGLDF